MKIPEPDWKDVEKVLVPFLGNRRLILHVRAIEREVKFTWNEGSRFGWALNRQVLFNAYFGHLKKTLKQLKKAEGDPEKAIRIIFDHEES